MSQRFRAFGWFVGFAVLVAGCGPVTVSTENDAVSSSESSEASGGSTAAASSGSSSGGSGPLHCDELPYVENVFWTSDYGPARADVRLGRGNFLECESPSYALCYYSGRPPVACTRDDERGIAECECYPYTGEGPYQNYIEIGGILNTCAYIETVRDCGWDGSACGEANSAPACQYLNQTPQTLQPGADLVSTFSFEQPGDSKFGCTDCESAVYAGCMTAPCYWRTNDRGEQVVVCECPLYEGPFQVGQDGATCDAGPGLVWSAAYTPSGCAGGKGLFPRGG